MRSKKMKCSSLILFILLIQFSFCQGQPVVSENNTAPATANTNTSIPNPVVPTIVQDPDYVVGIEDKLSISVWQHSDLSLDVIVGPDGRITFPLIGNLF